MAGRTTLSQAGEVALTVRRPTPPASAGPGTDAGAAPAGDVALARHSGRRPWLAATLALVGAAAAGVLIGPANLPWRGIALELVSPVLPVHSGLSATEAAVLWQIRLPRVALGALVGWMLGAGGAAYQGVFRNPLADPYLLGAAAGAGLGATVVIAYAPGASGWPIDPIPLAAFAGALAAVALAYVVATGAERHATAATVVLAGVAVAAFLTAIQTYLQQQHADSLRQVYSWILGRLSEAQWRDVWMVLPYVAVSSVVLLLHGRLLDVLRVGELEASTLGVDIPRTRLIVVAAATLGTAAVVAVSGLIGFVGIIIPHTARLTAGGSYRRVLPLSMIGGAALLLGADVLARTLAAPAEIPIGVITAFFGAPFFIVVLRRRVRL